MLKAVFVFLDLSQIWGHKECNGFVLGFSLEADFS